MTCKSEERLLDIIGERFGKLVVLKLLPRERDANGDLVRVGTGYPSPPKYLCQCDCGKQTTVGRHSLLSRTTKSCGCLKKAHAGSLLKIFRNKAGSMSYGCKVKQACGTNRCCWDCGKYETCTTICSKMPPKCGNYKGI